MTLDAGPRGTPSGRVWNRVEMSTPPCEPAIGEVWLRRICPRRRRRCVATWQASGVRRWFGFG